MPGRRSKMPAPNGQPGVFVSVERTEENSAGRVQVLRSTSDEMH